MEKVKIVLGGTPYTVATDKGAEYTTKLAEEIEAKISEVMKSGRFVSPSEATALTLLAYADELSCVREENDNMKTQLKDYLADAAQAKSERDMLRRELTKLKKGNGEF